MATSMEDTKIPTTGIVVAPKIPQGLAQAVEGLTREVIRHCPEDIYSFAARHFEKLLRVRQQYGNQHSHCLKPTDPNLDSLYVIGQELKRHAPTTTKTVKDIALERGWSLNETAKVLEHHRRIFGDEGQKMTTDEVRALANGEETPFRSCTGDTGGFVSSRIKNKTSERYVKSTFKDIGISKDVSNISSKTESRTSVKILSQMPLAKDIKTELRKNRINSRERRVVRETRDEMRTEVVDVERRREFTSKKTSSRRPPEKVNRTGDENCEHTGSKVQDKTKRKEGISTKLLGSSEGKKFSRTLSTDSKDYVVHNCAGARSLEELQSPRYIEKVHAVIDETSPIINDKVEALKLASLGHNRRKIETKAGAMEDVHKSTRYSRKPSSTRSKSKDSKSSKDSHDSTDTQKSDTDKKDPLESRLDDSTSSKASKKASISKDSRKNSHYSENSLSENSELELQNLSKVSSLPAVRPPTPKNASHNVSKNGLDVLVLPPISPEGAKSNKVKEELVLPVLSPPASSETTPDVTDLMKTSRESDKNQSLDREAQHSPEEVFRDSLNVTPEAIDSPQRPDSLELDDHLSVNENDSEETSPVTDLRERLKEIENVERSIERVLDPGNSNLAGSDSETTSESYNIMDKLREVQESEMKISEILNCDNDKDDTNTSIRSKLQELEDTEKRIEGILGAESGKQVNGVIQCPLEQPKNTPIEVSKGGASETEIEESSNENNSAKNSNPKDQMTDSKPERNKLAVSSLQHTDVMLSPHSYILTEGSPCDIPDNITTVIFPDRTDSPDSDTLEVEIEDGKVNSTKLSSRKDASSYDHTMNERNDNRIFVNMEDAFGEVVKPIEIEVSAPGLDYLRNVKVEPDFIVPRQDLHQIKEEEDKDVQETNEMDLEDLTVLKVVTRSLEEILEKDEIEFVQDVQINEETNVASEISSTQKDASETGKTTKTEDAEDSIREGITGGNSESTNETKETSITDNAVEMTDVVENSLDVEDMTEPRSIESTNEMKETSATDRTSLSFDPGMPIVPELNLDSLQDLTISSFKMTDDEAEKKESLEETKLSERDVTHTGRSNISNNGIGSTRDISQSIDPGMSTVPELNLDSLLTITSLKITDDDSEAKEYGGIDGETTRSISIDEIFIASTRENLVENTDRLKNEEENSEKETAEKNSTRTEEKQVHKNESGNSSAEPIKKSIIDDTLNAACKDKSSADEKKVEEIKEKEEMKEREEIQEKKEITSKNTSAKKELPEVHEEPCVEKKAYVTEPDLKLEDTENSSKSQIKTETSKESDVFDRKKSFDNCPEQTSKEDDVNDAEDDHGVDEETSLSTSTEGNNVITLEMKESRVISSKIEETNVITRENSEIKESFIISSTIEETNVITSEMKESTTISSNMEETNIITSEIKESTRISSNTEEMIKSEIKKIISMSSESKSERDEDTSAHTVSEDMQGPKTKEPKDNKRQEEAASDRSVPEVKSETCISDQKINSKNEELNRHDDSSSAINDDQESQLAESGPTSQCTTRRVSSAELLSIKEESDSRKTSPVSVEENEKVDDVTVNNVQSEPKILNDKILPEDVNTFRKEDETIKDTKNKVEEQISSKLEADVVDNTSVVIDKILVPKIDEKSSVNNKSEIIERVSSDYSQDEDTEGKKEYHIYIPETSRSTESTTTESSTFSTAVTKIQAGVRGFLTRRRLQSGHRRSSTLDSVPSIQESFAVDSVPVSMTLSTSTSYLQPIPESGREQTAAATIQHSYRHYKAKQRFRREDAIQTTTLSVENAFAENGLQHTSEFHDCIPLPVFDAKGLGLKPLNKRPQDGDTPGSASKSSQKKENVEGRTSSGQLNNKQNPSSIAKEANEKEEQIKKNNILNIQKMESEVQKPKSAREKDEDEKKDESYQELRLNEEPDILITGHNIENIFEQSKNAGAVDGVTCAYNTRHADVTPKVEVDLEAILQSGYLNFITSVEDIDMNSLERTQCGFSPREPSKEGQFADLISDRSAESISLREPLALPGTPKGLVIEEVFSIENKESNCTDNESAPASERISEKSSSNNSDPRTLPKNDEMKNSVDEKRNSEKSPVLSNLKVEEESTNWSSTNHEESSLTNDGDKATDAHDTSLTNLSISTNNDSIVGLGHDANSSSNTEKSSSRDSAKQDVHSSQSRDEKPESPETMMQKVPKSVEEKSENSEKLVSNPPLTTRNKSTETNSDSLNEKNPIHHSKESTVAEEKEQESPEEDKSKSSTKSTPTGSAKSTMR